MTIDTKKTYCAGINTNRGLIVVELDPDLAPKTVNNFVFLAQNHYFDGIVFHRVIQDGDGAHIIQSGDPLGKDPAKRGTGGPGYKFDDEPVKGNYTEGTIAMANSGSNTNGSQFFINTSDNSKTLVGQDGQKKYNLFGHVVKGMDIAKKIQGPRGSGDPDADKYKDTKPDTINSLIVVAA
ncbi:MAG: peptidylprolyl isomerase [Ktedonobacteraceae bacterium]|nr:peptidylprolyl isomerase [Ktedonobacteraceae bacterium]